MDDLPQPPSPQMVMEMGIGFAVAVVVALEAPRARAPVEVPSAEGGILDEVMVRCFEGRWRWEL